MNLLLRPHYVKTPRKRGRWGVRRIAYLVPKHEQHSLEWWLQHITDHLERGG